GIAGALTVTFLAASPTIGNDFIVIMFLTIVLGGLGSVAGAAIGAFVVGLVQSFSGLLLPLQLQNVMLFVVFVIIMLFLLQRLFGLRQRVREMPPTQSEQVKESALRAYRIPVVVVAIYFAIVMQVNDFYLSRLTALVAFWAALGMTWNLIGGYAGQLSLGHAAFVGLGGYITFILQVDFNLTPWIGMLASIACAALAALVVGAPTLKLSGIYFSLATLAYPLILQILFTYWGFQEALIPAHHESPFLFMQ